MTTLSAATLCGVGCAVEHPTSRAQRTEQKQEKVKEQAATPLVVPPTRLDEAQLVLQACGQPRSDRTVSIYDKVNNGPVRQIVYAERHPVMLQFIPSKPPERRTDIPAPLPHPAVTRAALPPGAVWEFSDARMDEEEMLTSTHLGVYLPCAALALHRQE